MNKIIISSLLFILFSCKADKNDHDATGVFEADETIISAQATGEIKSFEIEEGKTYAAGALVGHIDSTQLYLRKKQLLAQSKAVLSRSPNISAQLAALEEQLKQAKRERKRVLQLSKAEAATQKQLDDSESHVNILEKQIVATKSTLGVTSGGLTEETVPIAIQVEQLNDQLKKCRIINPVEGTVLVKYASAHEMAAAGKPLYKIADLSEMILRAYITGDQLPQIKIGQKVSVLSDSENTEYIHHTGTVTWISDKAEFTPKTIQTKNERANLVYAVKIRVPNDGSLKIGMYAEIKL